MGLIKVLSACWGMIVEACRYKNYAFQDPNLELCNYFSSQSCLGGEGARYKTIWTLINLNRNICQKYLIAQNGFEIHFQCRPCTSLVCYSCCCSSIRSLNETDCCSHYHIWTWPWFWTLTLEVIHLDRPWTKCSAMTIVSETNQIYCDCERPLFLGNIRVWWQIT